MNFLLRIREKIQSLTREDSGILILAAFIGLIIGFITVGLVYLLRYISYLIWGSEELSPEVIHNYPWWLIFIIPALGGIIVWVISNVIAPKSKGHGVPDVIEAILRKGGIIHPSVIWGKAFSSAISIGTGGSAGMEAPTVQIGGALGSFIGQIFKVGAGQLQTLVAAGTAAGLGAIFNAPMAGAIFAAEVIIGNFSIRNFSPIIIAAVVGTSVSHTFFGNYPAFQVPKYHIYSYWEYGFYIILGILSGFSAGIFIKYFYKVEAFFAHLQIPVMLKPAFGGLLVGIMGIFFPQIMGPGYDTIQLILNQHLPLILMLVLILLKGLATSFTLGSGGSGGVFAPAFFLGAVVGGSFGYIIHLIAPEITADYGAYAIVGMGGFMAGMISAPLSSILMIFEITTDYAIILPLMFTCIISAFVARKTFSSNIFSYVLDKKGINLKKGRDINLLRNIPVSEIIRTNYFHVHLNEKLSKVLTKIMKSRNTKFFVTDDEHHLKGVISINDIKDTMDSVRALGETFIAMDLARPAKFFCYEDDTLDKVIANMPSTDVGEIPVLDKENKLIGVINWHDIIRTYNNEIAKHNMVDQLFEDISEVDNRKEIEVHGDSLMIETQVPPEFIGKSLSELNLRKRYGITVIGIKKSSLDIQDTDTVEFSPDPHYIFQGAENIIFIVPKHKRNKIPFC